MWLADRWNEYEVLDTAKGEKLERWGEYLLVRPDPQVIWDYGHSNPGWKKKNAHYHRSNRGGGEWEFIDLPQEWQICYPVPDSVRAIADGPADLTFRLKPFHFKHTGLFPEQAANWDWFMPLIADEVNRRNDPDRPVRVLNLFAYTGGATIAAARAGAHVTHVDASKGMVSWAKDNARASGLGEAPIRYLVDDCRKFVEREIRRGNTYDAIIMDPPSYGRGPKGEIWKLEDALQDMVHLACSVLSKRPLFFLINSYTTGFAPGVLKYLLEQEMRAYDGTITTDELGLTVSQTGGVLPCGSSGRWQVNA